MCPRTEQRIADPAPDQGQGQGQSTGKGRVRGWLLRGAGIILVTVVSWAAGIAAACITAMLLLDVPVIVVAAIGTCLGVAGAGAWLVTRSTRHRRAATAVLAAAIVAVLVVSGAPILGSPLPSQRPPGPPTAMPDGVRHWTLPTGSRVAYRHLPADGPSRRSPVIVVGGGPGEAIVGDPVTDVPFRELTRHGYDVYLYDQIGAGLSGRLTDPSGYTVARHVADLEAIRVRLGVEQLILVGASWGGSLSASYLAEHPDRVQRMVVSSPGPIDYARWTDAGDATARLPAETRQRARDLLPGHPRFLALYLLGGIDPVAAHHLAPDEEMDAYFDTFLSMISPATVCDPANVSGSPESGNGLYSNMFTGLDARSGAQSTVRRQLRDNRTPTLVITGECNYVPWEPTAEYATTLPRSTLVCVPDAGHVVELDRPDLYAGMLRNFLLDRPLPVPDTSPDRPCHP